MTKITFAAELKEDPIGMDENGPILVTKVVDLKIMSGEVKTNGDRYKLAAKIKNDTLTVMAFVLHSIERSYPGSLSDFKKMYKDLVTAGIKPVEPK